MPQPLTATMADDLDLEGGWIIRLTAVDPSTGATITGVKVSNLVVTVDPRSGLVEQPPPDEPLPVLTPPSEPPPPVVGSGPVDIAYTVSGNTITLKWSAIAGAVGYEFLRDGARVANTWDGTVTSTSFSIPDGSTHVYEVVALKVADDGKVTYTASSAPPPPPPPPPPPTSGDYGPVVPVTNGPTDRTTYTGGNFDSWLRQLPAGSTGYLAQSATLGAAWQHSAGFPNNILLRPLDLAKPQTLQGRMDVRGDLVGWTVQGFILDDDVASTQAVSWPIGGVGFKLVHCTGSNGKRRIGLNFFTSSYGAAKGCVSDRCLWHDIGTPGDNHAQGVYDYGTDSVITDTKILRAAARGLQFRAGSRNATARYVWVEGCGEGVIFGDLGCTNALVTKSVFLNNTVTSRYLIETFDPGNQNVSNVVDDNYAWNDDGRQVVQPGLSGVSVRNLHHEKPPASGYGPRYSVGAGV